MSDPDSNTPNQSPPQSSTIKLGVVPGVSFADVLEDLAKHDDASIEESIWARPPVMELAAARHIITFQSIDIRESISNSNISEIHLFGVTKSGHSILVRVLDFEHYFYYPAPEGLSKDDMGPIRDYLNDVLQEGSSIISSIDLEDQSTSPDGKPIPFMKISLSDHRQIRRVKGIFTSGSCEYRDLFTGPELSFEASVPYFLRFSLDTEIAAMAWLKIPPGKYEIVAPERMVSCCQLEVAVKVENLLLCSTVDNREKYAPLRILSFDIECDVPISDDNRFSDPRCNSIIQIGNMVSQYGQSTPFIRNAFTLGTCSPISGTTVFSFEEESPLLMAWQKFFLEVDPDIVIGYNITQFDIPYLLNRARALGLRHFPFFGRIKSLPQRLKKRQPNWLECPGYEGRLVLDVFHHIRENHPGLPGEGAYKLNGVSQHFLGQRKEDIDYKQIPILQSGSADDRRDLAIYCLKDVYLPLLLLSKLNCFEKEVKAAKDANLPFNVLRTGRTLKDVAKRCADAIQGHYVAVDVY
ncbi:hypothetical protein M413DRAFT_444100 [Hebeloma cylindrosporum]|uniref:DNA polymerase delta catalytic subunit n=1 Tax=Hebeloma cylindrosporum TaxID=76867 RepID=A0A0C3C302_HEBCY|nr:hypothetical protein M413DRAFT_444100 [Hebeloma cylindrosporum h7]